MLDKDMRILEKNVKRYPSLNTYIIQKNNNNKLQIFARIGFSE